MKYLKFFTSGPGALVVILCFFVPWISVTCNGVPLGEALSGQQLATGSQLEQVSSVPILWFILVVGILVLGLLGFSESGIPQATTISGAGQIILAIIGGGVLWIAAGDVGPTAIGTAEFVRALFNNTPLLLEGSTFVFTAEWGLYGVLVGLVLIILGGIFTAVATPDSGHNNESYPQHNSDSAAFGSSYSSFGGGAPPSFSPSQPSSSGTDFATQIAGQDDLGAANTNSSWQQSGSVTPPLQQHPVVPPAGGGHKATVVLSRGPQTVTNAWLIVRDVDGMRAGDSKPLPSEGNFEMGRDGAGLQLNDSSTSGRHAVVRKEGDVYVLQDLASTNGTFVKQEGEWVQVYRHVLSDGDQIKLGRSIFSFVYVKATAEA